MTPVDATDRLGRAKPQRGMPFRGNFTVESAAEPPAAISRERIEAQIAQLRALPRITLRFESPLRMLRPRKSKTPGNAFYDRHYFYPGVFIHRTGARLEKLGAPVAVPDGHALPIAAAENRLVWYDWSYGADGRRKWSSGACGDVALEGDFDEAAATLVWGQCVNTGEGARFGMGAYRILELDAPLYTCPGAESFVERALRSPSIDRAAFEAELESDELARAANSLREGTYAPAPCQTVAIDTGRTLRIPAKVDRVLQRAVFDALQPGLDATFEESALGWRKGLGRRSAAQRLRSAYERGYRWALKSDFHAFFDTVPQGELEARLRAFTGDEATAALLMHWVEVGAPAAGMGLPTGAPISPLLGNLMLDAFDEAIAETGAMLVRYADDFMVLYKDESAAGRVYGAANAAAEALGLCLNGDKTVVSDLREPFTFLGFKFHRDGHWHFDAASPLRLLDELR